MEQARGKIGRLKTFKNLGHSDLLLLFFYFFLSPMIPLEGNNEPGRLSPLRVSQDLLRGLALISPA